MKFDWTKISILVVDDDNDLREILCEIFQGLGAEIFSAENGQEALGSIASQKVSLVLSDLQMPVMDGTTLLKSMKENNLNIPFIFITGQSHFTEEAATSLGADGLIYKPYKIKMMLEKIQTVLNPN